MTFQFHSYIKAWTQVLYCRSLPFALNLLPKSVRLPLRVWHCSQRKPVCVEYADQATASRHGTTSTKAATTAAMVTVDAPATTILAILRSFEVRRVIKEISL